MHRRTLPASAIAAPFLGGPASLAASAHPPSRPNKADWNTIQTAAHLRKMALARHRTARFRSFTASLGLGQLASIHPLAPGRCRNAVTDLFNNLLDLENAFPARTGTRCAELSQRSRRSRHALRDGPVREARAAKAPREPRPRPAPSREAF